MPVIQFKGKTAIESYHHTIPHHTLEFDSKLSVLPKGEKPSLDGNLIIEGDNLLALKALLPTHAGRIKCIYIDPPYNTGNESWVYNDNLTQPQFKEWIGHTVGKEGEDATRHDKWCCMMYPRLMLLKELLTDDGIIFVSIDDIEVSRLRLLLDEIFGADKFLANLVWKARQYPDARATTGISTDHEYVLVYGKSSDSRLRGGERDETKYSNPDHDPRGPWMSRSILGLAPEERRPNLHFKLVDPSTKIGFDPPKETGWRYEPPTMQRKIAQGRILFPKSPSGRPREKIFLYELQTKFPGFPSVIDGVYTADGTKEIREIFGSGVFPFPKPSDLIKFLLQQGSEDGDIVLDSFAGSGTTGHALLRLNKEEESSRRFILIQMPHETKDDEKSRLNICERITAERLRRVIRGYAFTGTSEEVLFERKLTLTTLKKADQLMKLVAEVKATNAKKCDEISTELKAGVLRVIGKKTYDGKTEGIAGSFTYLHLGSPLFGEYRDLGKRLPTYEELAKYIFYTEASQDFDQKALNPKMGKIGERGSTSYYLLYTPNNKEDQALDLAWLKSIQKSEKNRNLVVYCEKIWIHRDDLAKYQKETGRKVRPMLIPFNLK
jgi:adenine-specific DNA-methyltransferase